MSGEVPTLCHPSPLTYLWIFLDNLIREILQFILAGSDVHLHRFNASIFFLDKLVKPFLTASSNYHGRLCRQRVNGEGEGATYSCCCPDDEDAFAVIDAWHVAIRATRKG